MFIPSILNRRRYLEPGTFQLPWMVGFVFAIFTVLYELWNMVVFCLPPSSPVTAENANFTPVFFAFGTILSLAGYVLVGRKQFVAT